MEKKKAIICTVLYAFVLVTVLTISFFVKNYDYGISLYNIIMSIVAYSWLGNSVVKFYNWLKNNE